MYFGSFVTKDGDVFGEKRDQSEMFDDTVVLLSLDELRQVSQHAPSHPHNLCRCLVEGDLTEGI